MVMPHVFVRPPGDDEAFRGAVSAKDGGEVKVGFRRFVFWLGCVIFVVEGISFEQGKTSYKYHKAGYNLPNG